MVIERGPWRRLIKLYLPKKKRFPDSYNCHLEQGARKLYVLPSPTFTITLMHQQLQASSVCILNADQFLRVSATDRFFLTRLTLRSPSSSCSTFFTVGCLNIHGTQMYVHHAFWVGTHSRL